MDHFRWRRCSRRTTTERKRAVSPLTKLTGLNPASLEVRTGCKLEPSLADVVPGVPVQFERVGYFVPDPDSRPDALVFNRTVTLKDAWARIEKKQAPGQ